MARSPVNIDEVLSTLESCERRIGAVRWKSRFTRGTLASGEQIESFVPKDTPEFFEGTVLFDFPSGRYRGDFKMVNRWPQGAAPFIAHEKAHSFDGTTYRSFDKMRHGTELPVPDSPCWGYICRDRDPALTNLAFARRYSITGLSWMQPYIWTISDEPAQRLSTLIRGRLANGIPLTIEEENGLWRIAISTHDDDVVGVCCDPKRNYAVVEVTRANGEPLTVWERRVIDLRQFVGSVWLPEQIMEFGTISKPAIASRTELWDIELNPEICAETFEIHFPVGTNVEDSIAGESYIVGPNGTKRPNPCGCS